MSRYSTEQFIEKPQEEFFCSICKEVFDEPTETPCRHVFCWECISSCVMTQGTKCPLCREQFPFESLQPVLPLFKSAISRLQVKCKHQGCQRIMPLEECLTHQESCVHKIVSCPFRNCNKTCCKKDLNDHIRKCQFRIVECPRKCGEMIAKKDLLDHLCCRSAQIFGSTRNNLLVIIQEQCDEYWRNLQIRVRERERTQTELDMGRLQLHDRSSNLSRQSPTSMHRTAGGQTGGGVTRDSHQDQHGGQSGGSGDGFVAFELSSTGWITNGASRSHESSIVCLSETHPSHHVQGLEHAHPNTQFEEVLSEWRRRFSSSPMSLRDNGDRTETVNNVDGNDESEYDSDDESEYDSNDESEYSDEDSQSVSGAGRESVGNAENESVDRAESENVGAVVESYETVSSAQNGSVVHAGNESVDIAESENVGAVVESYETVSSAQNGSVVHAGNESVDRAESENVGAVVETVSSAQNGSVVHAGNESVGRADNELVGAVRETVSTAENGSVVDAVDESVGNAENTNCSCQSCGNRSSTSHSGSGGNAPIERFDFQTKLRLLVEASFWGIEI